MNNLLEHLHPLLMSFGQSAEWFCICLVIFVPLAYLFAGKPSQPYLRRDMLTDSAYWFFGPVFYAPIGLYITIGLVTLFYSPAAINQLSQHGLAPLASFPLIVQAFLVLLGTDFLQYWMHRFFHRDPLWRFHIIHHSPVEVDWLSAARFHPINIILYSTLMNAIIFTFGFSPEAFALLAPFNLIYSPLVHANLNWSYGPFRYLLASPVFHRWHHTSPEEGGMKNFAPTFPFLDLMFGTFYMPKGVQPVDFGAHHERVPTDFFGQIVYPFHKRVDK